MQPRRDASDPRFIPARLGGYGGFSYATKQGHPAPHRWRSIVAEPRSNRPLSIDADLAKLYPPERIRAKARAVLALTLERIERELDGPNELRINELAQVASSVGRVSGVANDDPKTGDIRIHIVRDPLPAHVQAKLLPTPHAVRDVEDANVIDNTALGVDGSGDA